MHFIENKELCRKLIIRLTIFISLIVAVLFCIKKQGFHYDENYSYYSTNITNGLWPSDHEWKSTDEIKSEYMVLDGESLNLGLVKLNQTYDVHPPLYYFVLRIVCFLSKGVFSKWQGLIINLVFYFICLLLLWKIADIAGDGDDLVSIFTLILFGMSPGFLSAITFIRMYVMLTVFCLLVLLIAMQCVRDGTWTFTKAYLPSALITCLGFLTHYYYMVFVFFVAAYVCIYLVVRKETRVQAFIYGGSICAGMAAAVIYYPACLSHIFSGYRGTESTQAFMDMSNTGERIGFFVQMLNDYTFSGMFYILALVGLLLYMFYAYRRKVRWAKKMAGDVNDEDGSDETASSDGIGKIFRTGKNMGVKGLLVTVTAGFFLIVCKTAMTPSNPAEALRYESPCYGLIILLTVLFIVRVFEAVTPHRYLPVAILILALACQIRGLCNDKVFFLYEGAQENRLWAKENSDADVVYIYNPANSWMIWNDGPELMEYRDIYFIPYDEGDDITDDRLLNSEKVIVYGCRCDEVNDIIEDILDKNERLDSYEQASAREYADIYLLR